MRNKQTGRYIGKEKDDEEEVGKQKTRNTDEKNRS